MLAVRGINTFITKTVSDIRAGYLGNPNMVKTILYRHVRPVDLVRLRADIWHTIDAHQRGGVLLTKDTRFAVKMKPFLKALGIGVIAAYGPERPDEATLQKFKAEETVKKNDMLRKQCRRLRT